MDTRMVVIAEVCAGTRHRPARFSGAGRSSRILPYTDEITEIVEAYFAHKLMPLAAQGDADHLALACFYNCDWLVTWNCKHLANANKFGHIHRVNGLLGLRTPALVTPQQLLEQP